MPLSPILNSNLQKDITFSKILLQIIIEVIRFPKTVRESTKIYQPPSHLHVIQLLTFSSTNDIFPSINRIYINPRSITLTYVSIRRIIKEASSPTPWQPRCLHYLPSLLFVPAPLRQPISQGTSRQRWHRVP